MQNKNIALAQADYTDLLTHTITVIDNARVSVVRQVNTATTSASALFCTKRSWKVLTVVVLFFNCRMT